MTLRIGSPQILYRTRSELLLRQVEYGRVDGTRMATRAQDDAALVKTSTLASTSSTWVRPSR